MNLAKEDLYDIREGIADEGMPVEFVWTDTELADPDKPWLGGAQTPVRKEAVVAFVNVATAAALITEWKDKADVNSSTLFGIMGNHGFEPKIGQVVEREGLENLVVRDTMAAAPAGVALFYVLEFGA